MALRHTFLWYYSSSSVNPCSDLRSEPYTPVCIVLWQIFSYEREILKGLDFNVGSVVNPIKVGR